MIINPNNPTGAVYSEETVKGLVDIARRHELVVFSDEIYEKILFDDAVHHHTAAYAGDDVLCLTFCGLSKAYRVCGYRAGWVMISGPKHVAESFLEGLTLLANMRMCANVPAQHAIQTALGGYQSINEYIHPGGRFYEQSKTASRLLNEIEGVSCVEPRGALYCFPRLDPEVYPIDDDEQFVIDLLRAKKILVTHGTGFNWFAPDHFRLVTLPDLDTLTEAIGRIAEFLATQRRLSPRPRPCTARDAPMGRRKTERLTLDHLPLLPGGCRECVFWELDPVRRRAARGHEAEEKAAWVSRCCASGARAGGWCSSTARWSATRCGRRRRTCPGADGFATAPVSSDAVVLTELHVDPAHRGGGLGRMLVQGMAKDLVRGAAGVDVRSRRSATPRGGATGARRCLVPTDFLLAVGFSTHRAHPLHPRMRMDLRTTLSLREELETRPRAAARARRAAAASDGVEDDRRSSHAAGRRPRDAQAPDLAAQQPLPIGSATGPQQGRPDGVGVLPHRAVPATPWRSSGDEAPPAAEGGEEPGPAHHRHPDRGGRAVGDVAADHRRPDPGLGQGRARPWPAGRRRRGAGGG